jgi:transcriptional regulator GlxA family with amidase domain
MRVDVLALDGVFDLGLSAVLDSLQTANELIEMTGLPIPPFEVRTVSVRRRVTTAQGLIVPTRTIGGRKPDCVVVPAIGYKMPEPLERALARRDIADAAAALRQLARGNTTICAACIGTFVLAESALLDGQRATTTWWLAPLFRRRYPLVRLEELHMIVASDRFVTAGAALSHVDLALWLVRRVSPALAALTAKYLIVDTRPSQSAFALTDHLVHADAVVQRFESWARPTRPGILARSGGGGDGRQQADAGAATAARPRHVAARLLSAPPHRARRAPAEDDLRQR